MVAHMGSDDIDLDAKLLAAVAAEVGGVGGVECTQVVEEVADASTVDAIERLVSGLATGALDPVAAQQLLIEQVLAEQLPGVAPERLEQLRLELATLLEGDPTLAGLLV